MKDNLKMSTCRCGKHTGDLVITRKYFEEIIELQMERARKQAIADVIHMLRVQQNTWWHETLSTQSSPKFHELEQLENLIKGIENLCQMK